MKLVGQLPKKDLLRLQNKFIFYTIFGSIVILTGFVSKLRLNFCLPGGESVEASFLLSIHFPSSKALVGGSLIWSAELVLSAVGELVRVNLAVGGDVIGTVVLKFIIYVILC